jgi:hypothetical protein
MPHLRLLPLLLLPLTPFGTALAFDPNATDILTLRLGMTEAETVHQLHLQGSTDIQRLLRGDDVSVRAATRDGWLHIRFGPAGARSVTYDFGNRYGREAESIKTSILDRYGTPSTTTPLAWCHMPAGGCPGTEPRLLFEQTHDGHYVLTLSASPP